jgi:predicted small metal-binding protein
MEKILECRDMGMDCDFKARGSSVEDVLSKAAEHAKKTHNMKEMSMKLLDKARSSIRGL